MAAMETTSLPVHEANLELMVNDEVVEHAKQFIPLPSHVREKFYALWKSSVIVKVVDIRHCSHDSKLFGALQFIQVPDYLAVLERGPWFVAVSPKPYSTRIFQPCAFRVVELDTQWNTVQFSH
ncbi:hypothetical protein CFP56_013540 [Quercus suber]|uniref:DUF4283 domain-containing protein n=1 Tax=Quercus suber TaxID=58331 RepID=A0AAW0KTE8_QUESU